MEQSEHQGHDAPAKFDFLLKLPSLQGLVAQETSRSFKNKDYHFCHILVDQDDVNVIPTNEALEGVLQENCIRHISHILQEI